MSLTPEERRRIYEEEKTRLEAQEQVKRDAQIRVDKGKAKQQKAGFIGTLIVLALFIGGAFIINSVWGGKNSSFPTTPSPRKIDHTQQVVNAIRAGQDYLFIYYNTVQGWIVWPNTQSYVSLGECEQALEKDVAAKQIARETKCIARAEFIHWLNRDRLGKHYLPYAHTKYIVIIKDTQGWNPSYVQLYGSRDECVRDVASLGYAIGPDLKCIRESDLEQYSFDKVNSGRGSSFRTEKDCQDLHASGASDDVVHRCWHVVLATETAKLGSEWIYSLWVETVERTNGPIYFPPADGSTPATALGDCSDHAKRVIDFARLDDPNIVRVYCKDRAGKIVFQIHR